MDGPEISVVVPTYRRPLRLRWLLNALEEQTVEPHRFEAVVACDEDDDESQSILREHPLAEAGALRFVVSPSRQASVKRNAAWRAASAPLIAFTDDDCRPPEDWLERALASAARHSGCVIQGRTMPDPDEWNVFEGSAWATTQFIDPPHPAGQTCNVVYPRELLERLGGFDEEDPMDVGEDTELLQRARDAGARYVGDVEMLTYHAVADRTLIGRLRWIRRWEGLPELVRRHPRFRRRVTLGMFWKPTHPSFIVAVAGVARAIARRDPAWLLLTFPWMKYTWIWHGVHPRGVIRSLSELPGRAVIDAAEILVLARGSVRHRSVFL